jgi:hypothetical protein
VAAFTFKGEGYGEQRRVQIYGGIGPVPVTPLYYCSPVLVYSSILKRKVACSLKKNVNNHKYNSVKSQ